MPARLAWRISPQLYAWRVRDGSGEFDDIPAALHAGIRDAVQSGYEGLEFSLSWLRSRGRTSLVPDLVHSHGLELAALFTTVNVVADEAILASIAQLSKEARSACSLLNLATVPDPRGSHSDKQVRESFDLLNTARVVTTLSMQLGGEGIQICWHPHAEHLRNGGYGLRRILEATDPATVGVCVDLGWVARIGGDCAAVLRMCESRLRLLHLRDVRDGVWCQALGEGELDLEAVGRQLMDCHYDGWSVVELWFERATRVTRSVQENARVSIDTVRQISPWRRG